MVNHHHTKPNKNNKCQKLNCAHHIADCTPIWCLDENKGKVQAFDQKTKGYLNSVNKTKGILKDWGVEKGEKKTEEWYT